MSEKVLMILFIIALTVAFLCSRFYNFYYSGTYKGNLYFSAGQFIENPFLRITSDLSNITLISEIDKEDGLLLYLESKDKKLKLTGKGAPLIGHNTFLLLKKETETQLDCEKFYAGTLDKADTDFYYIYINIIYTCNFATLGTFTFHNRAVGTLKREYSLSDFLYFTR